MACPYLPYLVDLHLPRESSRPRSMDPRVLLLLLRTLCMLDRPMRRRAQQLPRLIIPLSEDHRLRSIEGTSRATTRRAQLALPLEHHIMGRQTDDVMATLQPTPSVRFLVMIAEILLALLIRAPCPLDQAVSRTGSTLRRMLPNLADLCIPIASLIGETTPIDPNK